MGRRSAALVIVLACLLVLAGCGSPSEANDTSTGTEAPSSTTPNTSADTPALVATERTTLAADPDSEAASPASNMALIKNVTLREKADANGVEETGTVALRIRADTSVPTADGTGDPGDPYFTISINGEHEFTTAEVERTTDGWFTLPLDVSKFISGPGHLRIRVQLVDEDIAFDDEIATKTVTVEYPPTNSSVGLSAFA